MQLLIRERATVFRSPRSFGPVELGLSKVSLPDGAAPFSNTKENSQSISVLRSLSDLQIIVANGYAHLV